MGLAGADIARVGAIVLEQGEAALAMELVEALEIVLAPGALEAGGIAEGGLGARGHDHIVSAAHLAGGQQGVTADLDAL